MMTVQNIGSKQGIIFSVVVSIAPNYRIRATLMQIQSTNVPNLFKTSRTHPTELD